MVTLSEGASKLLIELLDIFQKSMLEAYTDKAKVKAYLSNSDYPIPSEDMMDDAIYEVMKHTDWLRDNPSRFDEASINVVVATVQLIEGRLAEVERGLQDAFDDSLYYEILKVGSRIITNYKHRN